MVDGQGEVRVRNVGSRRNDSFFESAMEFGGGLVRLGFSVATLPLALLPTETRGHMRVATKELMYAFATLPRDFADVAGGAIEEWVREGEPAGPAGPAGSAGSVGSAGSAVPPPPRAPRDELSNG